MADEAQAARGAIPLALLARMEAFAERWRAAEKEGDEGALAVLRPEGQALAAEVQAAKPARPADGRDVDATAALDEALTAAVGAGDEAAAVEAWLKVPAGEADRAIPDDARRAINSFIASWQSATSVDLRSVLAREAGQIAKDLQAARDIPDDFAEGQAAIDRAVAAGTVAPGAREAWEAIPEAPARSVPADSIERGFPSAILGVAGHVPNSNPPREWGGALISEGTVAVLSGEGSVAKSGLTCDLAVGIASCVDGYRDDEKETLHPLPGGLFRAQGGPVLMVTYEDPVSVTALKLQGAAKQRDLEDGDLARVHVLDMEGAPLFGPAPPVPEVDDEGNVTGESRAGFYNQRPEPLPGWRVLWREVERVKPVLVIIDPALAAYVGDAGGVAPVREFLVALTLQARKYRCGVLIVAHSTKAARGAEPDPLDPGNVAGSAAWFDGVRAVAVMQFDPGSPPDVGLRTLSLPKVNYGHGRIGCIIEPVRLHGGAIVGFDIAGTWEHLTATTRGEKEVKGGKEDRGKERPYNPAGAVIDAVRVLCGAKVSQEKEDSIREAEWEEARGILDGEGGDAKAAEREARRRYGLAKKRELERETTARAYEEAKAKGGGSAAGNRGGNSVF